MGKVVTRPATYEDLLKVPDHLIAEIVEGELHTSPRPSGAHERAMTAVVKRIGPAFDDGINGPGGWWIAMEPEMHLSGDILVPDLAGWRRERVSEYMSGAAWDVAPDWVCEVLSPSTARFDRIRKLPKYARHNVSWAWLVDPSLQSLEIFRLERGQWVLTATYAGDEIIRPEPFDAADFPLGSLWLHPASA
ncbi:MAG TPA: Uma2 family endonuclease [Thermoanaerobaculia bacterium]